MYTTTPIVVHLIRFHVANNFKIYFVKTKIRQNPFFQRFLHNFVLPLFQVFLVHFAPL